MKNTITYNGIIFTYYPKCWYPGKSIISNKYWKAGTAIYWNTEVKNGFTEEEAVELNLVVKNTDYHIGPVNSEYTFDDSVSRNFVKQFFKSEFNIDLFDHPGLFVLDNNGNYVKVTDGKYCEDLIGYSADGKLIFVEVERSAYFNKLPEVINILTSKYYKYFMDGEKNNIHYMCFIDIQHKKLCLIKGTDIKFSHGNFVEIAIGNKLKEVYQIDGKYGKLYDLDLSPEKLIDACCITY